MSRRPRRGANAWQKITWAVRRILMLKCPACERLESDRLDRRLSWIDVLARWGHLLACGHCRQSSRQMQQIEAMISRTAIHDDRPPQWSLPDAARNRIADRLRAACQEPDSPGIDPE